MAAADGGRGRRLPLRWVMVLPTLVTFTLGFGAFAAYIDGVERANLLADIDDELVRAERGTPGARPGPPVPDSAVTDDPPPADASVTGLAEDVDPPVQLLLAPDGQQLSPGRDDPFSAETLAALSTRRGTTTLEDPRYRVSISEASDGTLMVTALPLDRMDSSVQAFRRTLLLGGLVILTLVAAVVWLLTARSVRPVTRMAATATRIADGELGTDVHPPTGSRETADLAAALDHMLGRLRATIEDHERAARDAAAARDAMRRFLADVSHELRTPLTALKGYSDLYGGGMLEEPGALDRAMSRIGDESERLHRLVSDMLQLAREVSPAQPTELVDVAAVVGVVAEDLRAAHPSTDVRVDVGVQARTQVMGQPARLHQAVLNVVSNACRYAPSGTPVHLVLRSSDTDLVLEVIDHGPGVDPAEAKRILLPFYRPETARDRTGGGGAGLGLAIAAQALAQHGGAISVEATQGGGATFVLRIPLAPDGTRS